MTSSFVCEQENMASKMSKITLESMVEKWIVVATGGESRNWFGQGIKQLSRVMIMFSIAIEA